MLTWSSTETNGFPTSGPEFTHASVFDPITETFVNADNNFHDMFCAGISTLENGLIVASGGNPFDKRTTAFDPATMSWMPLSDMNDNRWYGTNITLPNNQIFSSFAKAAGNNSEVFNPVINSWSRTPHATMQQLLNEQNQINANAVGDASNQEWWAHLAISPQGDVFQGGPTPTWHRLDPLGGATNVSLGQPIGDTARMYGNAVSYDIGKVLLIGGSDRRSATPTSVNNVFLVDLNGASPVVTPGAPMNYARAFSNSVMLPNGEVLVVGGNAIARKYYDLTSVLPAEIYNPATDSWRLVDSLAVSRDYHSTAVLLKDGRILAAGGGGCGDGCNANHLDGQIYSPPYLFNSDGSLATRPTLSNTPTQVEAGDQVVVTASNDTTSFAMVRLSGTTHHLNTDQRFIPLNSVDNGNGTFTLTFPANPNVLIVGNYWLFAVNTNGTPSFGETVQVFRNDISIPPQNNGEVYISDRPWQAVQNGLGPAERDTNNGDAAEGDGGVIELDGISYAKGVGVYAYSEITIDLAGQYTRFQSDIGLDDVQDGQCGNIRFEVDVDGFNQYSSGGFIDTTPTETIDVDVTGASTLSLKVLDNNADTCGDRGNWANARLTPAYFSGYRYYRFTPTKLRFELAASAVHLSEFALFKDSVRLHNANVLNPGGNNPPGAPPENANDENIFTKWQDANKGALVYDYGANVEIDSYSFTTGDDAVEQDPVQWLIEASRDGIAWIIIDDQTAADYPTPIARRETITPIAVQLPELITPLPEAPRNSATLLVENHNGNDRIWNTNPDNNSVSVSDDQGSLLVEIPVGNNPWALAKHPNADIVLVTNKKDATITVINTISLAVSNTINLPYASQPHGVIFDSTGTHYYVALEALARLEKRDSTTHNLVSSLQLSGAPKHLSIKFDDSRIYVSNFITPPLPGEDGDDVDEANSYAEVFAIDPVTLALVDTIDLPYDTRQFGEFDGPGMPNYLSSPVVSFDDQSAYIPSKKDHVGGGGLRGFPGMTFESTVRANTSRISLSTETEDATFRLDHDNASVTTHAALSGENRYLFTTLETSRELAVYDTVLGFEVMRLPTGRAPQSVALSSDGSIAYVHNFMDRSISRFDLTQMIETELAAENILPTINVVSSETLAPNILLGKQLFYDAWDARLAQDKYLSCASCHKEGKDDGRVWDLTSMGEGIRNTRYLLGAGSGHGLRHWTGNFDEVQDFENQIRTLAAGTGLMSQTDFDATSDVLGPAKAGLSSDLDAMAAYVDSLTVTTASPHRPSPAALSSQAETGKLLFISENCGNCHLAPQLTDSEFELLHNVGTIDLDSGQRLGSLLTGFDTPTVLSAWAAPPFLHDGSAATLQDAIAAHSSATALTSIELDDLAAFLREAEPTDLAGLTADTDKDGVFDNVDPDINDPCIPSAFNSFCTQDTDGDGTTDFDEGEFTDSDGDGLYDYQESSVEDTDSDTVPDQLDPENENACVPDEFFCQENVPMLQNRQLVLFALLMLGVVLYSRKRIVLIR